MPADITRRRRETPLARGIGEAAAPRLPARLRDAGTIPLFLRRLTPIIRIAGPFGIAPGSLQIVATVDAFSLIKSCGVALNLALSLAHSPFGIFGFLWGIQHLRDRVLKQRQAREEESMRRNTPIECAVPTNEIQNALILSIPVTSSAEVTDDGVSEIDTECASECSEWSVITETSVSSVVEASQQDAGVERD